MSEFFSIGDLKSGSRLEQWAALEIERLQRELNRALRIANSADRMYDAIHGVAPLLSVECVPDELISLMYTSAECYDEALSDQQAEATDTPALCRRCQAVIDEGHDRG